ncbi:MAG TPA: hypothetical protein VIJ59_09840 [Caulobacteraceae bacterium]
MKYQIAALALGAGLCMAGVAAAEPWTDWTPTKGATEVITIKVDPNHIDDYLTGLSRDWVQGQEMAKRRGLIDWYQVSVKLNSGAGANVLLISHYPSLANLEPDKARDQAMLAEARSHVSKDQETTIVSGYDKYRTFVSDDIWTAVDFKK